MKNINKKGNAVIAINLSNGGSSGIIMNAALKGASEISDTSTYKIIPHGKSCSDTICYANKESKFVRLVKELFYKFHSYNPIDGTYFGFYTKKVIRTIKKIASKHNKIIIHLHNLHHSQLNVLKLLKYISKQSFNIVITAHDAWFYTGGCYCYAHIGCENFKNNCENCPLRLRLTKKLLKLKKLYLNIPNRVHVVAVSNWEANEIEKSYLSNCNISTIFGCSDIIPPKYSDKTVFGQESKNKKIILSVSDYWNEWKGVDYLQQLSLTLPNDHLLVLVGGSLDISNFKNTIHINQIQDRQKMAMMFSSADVYVCTSQTETLGLSSCEAQICGCPVVTFGCGGSKETIIENQSGFIVENKNINLLLLKIIEAVKKNTFQKDNIMKSGSRFFQKECIKKYNLLYRKILDK